MASYSSPAAASTTKSRSYTYQREDSAELSRPIAAASAAAPSSSYPSNNSFHASSYPDNAMTNDPNNNPSRRPPPPRRRRTPTPDWLKQGSKQATTALSQVAKDFIQFISRGNVFDLAVGIVMGAAFTLCVTSAVNDILTPPIGAALQSNLENAYLIIRCPRNGTIECDRGKLYSAFPTPALAKAAGIVTWNWGNFLQTIINFLITSLIVFLLVKAFTAAFRRKPAKKTTRECPMCAKDIPIKAHKCFMCHTLSEAEGEEKHHDDTDEDDEEPHIVVKGGGYKN